MKTKLLDRSLVKCPACLGDGEIWEDMWEDESYNTVITCCEICSGSGWVEKWKAEELEPQPSCFDPVEEF